MRMIIALVQLIICMAVPCGMAVLGNYRKRKVPAYGKKGLMSVLSRARASKAAWSTSNMLFFSLFYTSGLNLGLITFVLFLIVDFFGKVSWSMCLSLLAVQLIGGICLPLIVTAAIIKRSFNEDGELIAELDEESEE